MMTTNPQVGGPYVPPAGDGWERRTPSEAGFDPGRLDEAIAYALAHESPFDRDLAKHLTAGQVIQDMPDRELVGPTKVRGAPNGLLLRGGRLVAEWGDPHQV